MLTAIRRYDLVWFCKDCPFPMLTDWYSVQCSVANILDVFISQKWNIAFECLTHTWTIVRCITEEYLKQMQNISYQFCSNALGMESVFGLMEWAMKLLQPLLTKKENTSCYSTKYLSLLSAKNDFSTPETKVVEVLCNTSCKWKITHSWNYAMWRQHVCTIFAIFFYLSIDEIKNH